MSLPERVQGALYPSLAITWYEKGTTTPVDLTGATLTGTLTRQSGGETTAIMGTLELTDAANGEFRWDLHADDVATPGSYWVQFNAAYASGPTPGRTFDTEWQIMRARTVSA